MIYRYNADSIIGNDVLNGIIEAWYFDKKELVISVED